MATLVLGLCLRRHLELSALDDLDILLRLVAAALSDILDLVDDIIALEDFAEDDVLAIEPAGRLLA
jgi:hypothetical protein